MSSIRNGPGPSARPYRVTKQCHYTWDPHFERTFMCIGLSYRDAYHYSGHDIRQARNGRGQLQTGTVFCSRVIKRLR